MYIEYQIIEYFIRFRKNRTSGVKIAMYVGNVGGDK